MMKIQNLIYQMLIGCFLILSSSLAAQYNECAGMNVIYDDSEEVATELSKTKPSKDRRQKLRNANKATRKVTRKNTKTGKIETVEVKRNIVKTDKFGNAKGNQ